MGTYHSREERKDLLAREYTQPSLSLSSQRSDTLII